MKWKEVAALGLALIGWSRFSKTTEEADPGQPQEYIVVGTASDPCPPGKYRVGGFAEQGFGCIPEKK